MVNHSSKRLLTASDEVSLFPGYARPVEDGARWRVDVHGAVFDPNDIRLRKRMLLSILQRVMKIEQSSLESPVFQQRIRTFVAATERGKRISVRIGNEVFPLKKKTKRNGHFRGRFYIDNATHQRLVDDGRLTDDQVAFEIVLPEEDTRFFRGRIHFLQAKGISVVSDIDDTIKFTDVTTRKELVENTFFREFRTVDSIADVYQDWAGNGADFHYVSSSPWQLLRPLSEMFSDIELPQGTMHLRNFVLRDQMIRRVMLIRRPGKSAAIRDLLKAFPQRKFVFVGDSRERDPEMYAKLCRQFPSQVISILIREWEDRPMTPERVANIDECCGGEICHSFESAEELRKFGKAIFAVPLAASLST